MSSGVIDPMVGRALGDFVIRERIGRGGSGEVFRADQVSLGREAVIKVLERSRALTTGTADKFLHEARLASRLEHPYAAHVYAFGAEADGLLWIAMELVRGTPLDRLIKQRGALPLTKFVPFLEKLAEVLNAAHEQGIVHRDVKPANVMVVNHGGKWVPKLLDLGIAKVQTKPGPPGGQLNAQASPDIEFGEDGESLIASGRTPNLVGDPIMSSAPITSDPDVKTDPRLAKMLGKRMLLNDEVELTGHGGVVGTPHFMAPEQWSDPMRAEPQSDQYSLAILCFEAITGRLPFDSKTIQGMARTHAKSPLPSLGNGLPEALHATLSRGAAKRPEHRFANTLEYAAAFRAASGIGVDPVSLPQLDARLREAVLSEAPQPIADAVALLDAARTPKQAVEAVQAAHKVVARYLGVMALASRARIGAGVPNDSLEVARIVEKLAASHLETVEWLQLAKEICRPFATVPEAHVLPELVSFFFLLNSQSSEASRSLTAMAERLWPSADAPEDVQVAFLHQVVPALSVILSSVSFVFDYALMVNLHGDAERWMGARRVKRAAQEVLDGGSPEGSVVLMNSAGAAVVSLSPLVQAIAPSVGAPEELFFLDGTGRFGARLLALPGVFERQDPALWSWFSKHILNVGASLASRSQTDVEPYKGLSTFTTQDADNYFGREKEAQGFANRLRSERLLAVVGPSGAGKSSFILAGVLPLLPKGFKPLVFRPGAAPMTALTNRLAAEGIQVDKLSASPLDAQFPPEMTTLVLVIDQFEELVTLCLDVAQRQRFAKLLTDAADATESRVRIVLTMRDDFLIKVMQLEAFRERLSSALQLLGTPANEDLLRVVTEPARRVGYTFDDDNLPKRMVEAVAEYPGALALLSFTASQLWQMRDRHLQQMRAKTYEALGGVGGALAHHAEATLTPLPPVEQKLVREAFRQLVTGQGTRAVLSRKEVIEVLGNDGRAESVLNTLVNARLLVTSESATGEDQVEIIHEALIVSWPRLVSWLREDAETARLRDALRASARQWEERNRPRGLLWRAETLTEYRLWRARFAGHLTSSEQAFATASLADERRGQVVRRVLAVSAFVGLIVGLVVIFRAYRQADANAKEARERVAGLRQEQGRQAMLNERPLEALAYLDAARSAGAAGYAIDHMLKLATWQARGEIRRYPNLGSPKGVVSMSPDGSVLALPTAANLQFIDLDSGKLLRTLPIKGAATGFSPDGKLFAAASGDGTLQLFDAHTYAPVATGALGGKLATYVEFSSDSSMVAISMGDRHARVVSVKGELVADFDNDADTQGFALRFSPDSAHVFVTTGFYETIPESPHVARVFDLKTHKTVFELKPVVQPINGILFDRANNQYLLAASDGELSAWPSSGGARLEPNWRVAAHRGRMTRFALSPDGSVLATFGFDGQVRFFDPRTGKAGPSVSVSPGALASGLWSADGRSVYANTSDGSVHHVLARTGDRIWRYPGISAAQRTLAERPGGSFVEVMLDGTIRLLDSTVSAGKFEVGDKQVRAAFGQPRSTKTPVLTDHGWFVLAEGAQIPVEGSLNVDAVSSVSEMSGDGSRLAALNKGKVAVFTYRSGAYGLETELSSEKKFIFLSVSPDGRALVLEDEEGFFHLFSGTPLLETKVVSGEKFGLGPFSNDGQFFYSSTLTGLIQKRDAKTGEIVASVQDGSLRLTVTLSVTDDSIVSVHERTGEVVLFSSDLAKRGSIAGAGMSPIAAFPSEDSRLLHLILSNGVWETWDLASDAPLSRVSILGQLSSALETRGGALVVGANGAFLRADLSLTTIGADQVERAIQCATPVVLSGDRLHVRPVAQTCIAH